MTDFLDPPMLEWWYYTDISIHCECGYYIEVARPTDTPREIPCPQCGRKWQVSLIIKKVSENGAP